MCIFILKKYHTSGNYIQLNYIYHIYVLIGNSSSLIESDETLENFKKKNHISRM